MFVRLELICWTPSSKSFMWWAQVGAATERPSTESPTTPPQRSWQNQVVTKRAGDQSATWGLTSSVKIMEWALRCVLLEVRNVEEMDFTARIHILGRLDCPTLNRLA